MLRQSEELPLARKREAEGSETGSLLGNKKYQSEFVGSRQQSQFSDDRTGSRRSNRSRNKTPSKSPPIKYYDPLAAEQDKVLRKKEREDIYHSQHITEEPILLIKKREIITKYMDPSEHFEPLSTSTIIKKSDKSKYVTVDYDTAKRKIEELTSRE